MALNLKESFERSCRLCAKEQDVTLMIFSAEAEALLLKNKLNKYLLLEVEEDDKLPKNICIQCCTKLQTVCDFIDTVHKSQDILLNLSIDLDKLQTSTCEYTSLSTHELPSITMEDESKITPMEISIDPMVILQNSDFSPSVNDSCLSQDEDVARMHGLDDVDVTIKLIKKGEHFDSDDCKGSEGTYYCLLCSKYFPSLISLTRHNLNLCRENEDKDDYTCSICKQEFIHKNQLIEHLKTHRAGGTCNECGRHFRNTEKLSTHMAMHATKENAFSCNICGRSYKTPSHLKAHSIAHSNVRPFQCKVCNKTFKRNQELKFHMNQHTGAKPYQCPFCDKTFANSGNCYAHRRRIHPGRTVQKRERSNKIIGQNYTWQQSSVYFNQQTNTIEEQNTVQDKQREKRKQTNHYNDVEYVPSDSIAVPSKPEDTAVALIETSPYQDMMNKLWIVQPEENNADQCITNSNDETKTLVENKITDENNAKENKLIITSEKEKDFLTPNNVEQHTQSISDKQQTNIDLKICTYPNSSLPIPNKEAKKLSRNKSLKYKATNSTASKLSKSVKYACYLCPKKFNRRDNYTYHIYQHTGKKPFKCTFCSERFVTRKGLLIHHNNQHPTYNRPLALLSKNLLLM